MYNDRIVSNVRSLSYLNSVDSYNKEEDFDNGKISRYEKKYVKLNVPSDKIELVVEPTGNSFFYHFDERNFNHYKSEEFQLSNLYQMFKNK